MKIKWLFFLSNSITRLKKIQYLVFHLSNGMDTTFKGVSSKPSRKYIVAPIFCFHRFRIHENMSQTSYTFSAECTTPLRFVNNQKRLFLNT